jgi:hypothetical protein
MVRYGYGYGCGIWRWEIPRWIMANRYPDADLGLEKRRIQVLDAD